MSGIARIYDAVIDPGKDVIAERFGGIEQLIGSYRLVDTEAEEVGIEVLIGHDMDSRLLQLPLSYRSTEVSAEHRLTTMEHNILGRRYITNALADPVAVREFIRTIITADDGATYSNGDTPAISIQGSGSHYAVDIEVGKVELGKITGQRAEGTVVLNGLARSFGLRLPRILNVRQGAGVGYEATRMNLHGTTEAEPEKELRVAELFWRDVER